MGNMGVAVLLTGACKQCPALCTEPPLWPDFHPTFRCARVLTFAAMLEVLGHGSVGSDKTLTLVWLYDSTQPMMTLCMDAVDVVAYRLTGRQRKWSSSCNAHSPYAVLIVKFYGHNSTLTGSSGSKGPVHPWREQSFEILCGERPVAVLPFHSVVKPE